jgi:hypothetical protein
MRRDADEKHYVMAGRYVTVMLFFVSSGMVFVLDTAKDAFDVILQIGAGTGLLYLIRWFWWRVNAWCEVVAMVSSFLVSAGLLILAKNGVHFSTHAALLATIAITTACWVATAYLGPETDHRTLLTFYRKVKPFGPGWNHIRKEAMAGVSGTETTGENIPLALLGWVSGTMMIWSSLFTVGNVLYGRWSYAAWLFVTFVVSGSALLYVVKRLWTGNKGA